MDVSFEVRPANCAEHGSYESRSFGFAGKILHWSGCSACGEIASAKRKDDEKKAETIERQRRIEARMNLSAIPLRFRGKTFDSFVADTDGKEKALAAAMEFAGSFPKHWDMGTMAVFSGQPGTGKSHLATSIGQAVMQSHTVLYTSAIDAVRMVRDTWRRDSTRTETQVLAELASVDLLIMDEVGVQYGTEAEQVTLFDIIDKRYRDLMPTLLLTNLNSGGMKAFLGDRSYDRLREGGMWITFDWPSQRGPRAS